MEILLKRHPVTLQQVNKMAEEQFGDLVKATVDVEQGVVALGGELHADEEAFLLENGSKQSNLWEINIYPFHNQEEWIKFDSMINIRPRDNNRSRDVEDEKPDKKSQRLFFHLSIQKYECHT